MTHIKSPTWTRPDAEPWWEPNPLAVGTFCPVCETRLTDTLGAIRACPFGPHDEEADR